MRFFTRKNVSEALGLSDIEVVREKLADCLAEIEAAEGDLDRLALQAVLADDHSATAAAAHLAKLRQRRELLSRACAGAEQAEREAQDTATVRDHLARRRAAAQHASRLEKLARSVSEAEASLLAEFAKMIEAASALVATLPSHLRSRAEPWDNILRPEALKQMALLEGDRLNRQGGPVLFERPAFASAHERRNDGSLPTLVDRIAEMTARVRAHFDLATPGKPQTPPPAPIVPAASEASEGSLASEEVADV